MELNHQDSGKKMCDVLSKTTRDYWVSSENDIIVLENPSPLQFMRVAVAGYKPVIIRGIMDGWGAMQRWNMEYFKEVISENVNVNFTPDGMADAVKMNPLLDSNLADEEERIFTYPYPASIPFSLFYDMMMHPEPDDSVPYLSEQNDNLRAQLPILLGDIPNSIALATEAFNCPEIEAVNLWIGDERNVSSIHKDHFENFYCVVEGEKSFTLLPPTDTVFLPEYTYATAKYELNASQLSLPNGRLKKDSLKLASLEDAPDGSLPSRLSWIALDPDDVNVEAKYPQFGQASPIRCVVRAGEVLYIPSMWYHRVSQTRLTIAVNYWMEQKFDFRFALYQTVRSLVHPIPEGLLDDQDMDS